VRGHLDYVVLTFSRWVILYASLKCVGLTNYNPIVIFLLDVRTFFTLQFEFLLYNILGMLDRYIAERLKKTLFYRHYLAKQVELHRSSLNKDTLLAKENSCFSSGDTKAGVNIYLLRKIQLLFFEKVYFSDAFSLLCCP
jgi:hypothetical protein